MKSPWFITNPMLYARMQEQVAAAYTNLHFSVDGRTVFLRGSFPLMENGCPVDRFLIEVEFPVDYPRGVPMVRETGGRIPRTFDRHIYGSSGVACLFVPDARWWVYPEGTDLLDFLNGPVRNFFVGQSLFELEKIWPFGQRSHGVEGILEFYTEILATHDRATLVRYIDVLRKKEMSGHWPCPCGSGRRLRHCHLSQVIELRRRIPYIVASRTWNAIDNSRLNKS